MPDRVRERWASGEVALNAWLTWSNPSSAAVVANAGFDAVTVDLQHGAASIDDAGALAGAIEPSGAVPFARMPSNDPAVLMRVLDLGVRGVVCPMVNSAAEAAAFVGACRYPPMGARSYGPIRSALGAGREHTEAANDAVLTFAQIETAEGLRAVAEICATPGLDGLYVGPADLSLSLGMGSFADLRDATMLDALDRILAGAAAAGVVPGVHAPSIEGAVEMAARGFRFVGCAADADLLEHAALRTITEVRTALRPPSDRPSGGS